MAYELPKLPYAYDALEPYIDAETMELHHSKHHQTYVDKLNAALEGHPDLQPDDAKDVFWLMNELKFGRIPAVIETAVRNHGGGHANHSFFWEIMAPDASSEPTGELAEAINSAFGSFSEFQRKFTESAASVFGSGWVWLVTDNDANLFITQTKNQENPWMNGEVGSQEVPILGLDVWEHAYYLKYRNKRPDYIEAWWKVINWAKVAELYAAAK